MCSMPNESLNVLCPIRPSVKYPNVSYSRTLRLEEVHDSPANIDLPAHLEKSTSLTQTFPLTGDVQTHDELKRNNQFLEGFGLTPSKDDVSIATVHMNRHIGCISMLVRALEIFP